MTARSYAQYPDNKILTHCRCITLDDLVNRDVAITQSSIKALSNAFKTASSYEYEAHLMEWPDGVLVCVVSAQGCSFSDLSSATKVAAYRKAFSGLDFIYTDLPGGDNVKSAAF